MSIPKEWITAVWRRVNLWLLLGIFFCTGMGLVAANTVLMIGFMRDHTKGICEAVQSAYEAGGVRDLSLVTRGVAASMALRVHLLDSTGRDLVTGNHYPASLSHGVSSPWFLRRGVPRLIAKTEQHACIIDPPLNAPTIPLGPISWVLPFVSVLCCSVGLYVTWRMRRIEAVVTHFGSGRLDARMTADSSDAIGRLAQAFNQMADRIESLVASHQRLCVDMAHELRSPMSRLMLALRGARHGAPQSLERVENEATRINEMIDQLLDVSRAEVDPAILEVEALDLESLLTEITDRCRVEAAEKQCEIEVTLEELGFVECDEELLRRAIENILRNAIQHTAKGTPVQLSASAKRDSVEVVVRDYGPGVPVDALPAIFRPFYRADPARGRSNGGVGLGLSIVQRAVALHGGVVRAENSTPGLRVVISIPRRRGFRCPRP